MTGMCVCGAEYMSDQCNGNGHLRGPKTTSEAVENEGAENVCPWDGGRHDFFPVLIPESNTYAITCRQCGREKTQ